MAKNDWKSLLVADPVAYLAEAKKPKADPVADRRAKAVQAIDGALAQLEANAEPSRMSLYKFEGDMARVTVKVGRNLVLLPRFHPEKKFGLVPKERLKDFYESIKSGIEAGELDAELASAAGDEAPVKKPRGRRKAG